MAIQVGKNISTWGIGNFNIVLSHFAFYDGNEQIVKMEGQEVSLMRGGSPPFIGKQLTLYRDTCSLTAVLPGGHFWS